MNTDHYPQNHLGMLHFADSAFPTGAISFSQGLESLVNSGLINGAKSVSQFLSASNTAQSNTAQSNTAQSDSAQSNTTQSVDQPDKLIHLDSLIHAHSLVSEQREGSIRMGKGMLSIHQQLDSDGIELLNNEIQAGRLHGHLPVVQGVLWSKAGFNITTIQAMAAHGVCTGVLGAAVRLSAIGFVDAQRIHKLTLPLIEKLISHPVPAVEHINNFVPLIDVYSMHHETDEMRLFMN